MRARAALLRRTSRLWASASPEEGQAMVEYALLISLIAVACFGAVQTFGLDVSILYSRITAVVH
jgi:Flp pilus assembly pilin Flp